MNNFEIFAILDRDKNLTIESLPNQNQGENNCTDITVSVPVEMAEGYQFFLEFLCPKNKRYVSPQMTEKQADSTHKKYFCKVPSCVLQEEGFVTFQLVARKTADNTVVYKSNQTNRTSFFVYPSVNATATYYSVDDYFANVNGELAKETLLRETADKNLHAALTELVNGFAEHTARQNPHCVTKAQVGLDRAENTADGEKYVFHAQRALSDENGNTLHETYAKKSEMPTALPANGGNADTVDGKHASDFATSAQGTKADSAYQKPTEGIPSTDLSANVQSCLEKADTAIQSLRGYATETYVDAKVAGLVNSAPEALDTLNELATALGNDPNFATTVATEIGKKVDKVDGKGLSQNDYTDEEKLKLAGIEKNANKYVLPVAGTTLGGVKSGGDVTVLGDGTVVVNDNRHNHTTDNVTDLQTKLNAYAKLNDTQQVINADSITVERTLQTTDIVADTYFIGDSSTSLVVGSTGTNDIQVMSQKAVTDALAIKADKTQLQGLATEAYVDSEVTAQINGTIVQTTGSNVSAVMSQKAVTDALASKADKTQLQGLATEAYVDGEVTAQINGAIGKVNSLLDAISGEVI